MNFCVLFFRGFIITFIFVVTVSCLIANKISLVWLLSGAYTNATTEGTFTRNTFKQETWYVTVGLVLFFPYFVALFRGFYNSKFFNKTPAQQWQITFFGRFVVGVIVSVVEVVSLMLFTLEVAPWLPAPVLLPLLSAVFAMTLPYDIWGKRQSTGTGRRNETRTGLEILKLVGQLLLGSSGIWALCAIALLGAFAFEVTLPLFQALCLPLSLMALSITWNPRVQIYIVQSLDGTYGARWKAIFFYSILKVILIVIGLSAIMIQRLDIQGFWHVEFWNALGEGFEQLGNAEVLVPLLTNILTSLGAHIFFFLSAKLCVTFKCIVIPSIAATPIAVGLVIFFCVDEIAYLTKGQCNVDDVATWVAVVLAFLIWITPFVLRGVKLCESSDVMLKPFIELFIQPTWNGIFLDQNNFLNYTAKGFTDTRFIHNFRDKNLKPKVYICTTMFREARWEMARLLKSFRKVVDSKILSKSIDVECHIYIDQGAHDRHYSEFSAQLVSLLEERLKMSLDDVTSFEVAYGIQLYWTLLSPQKKEIPFYIHMKDPKKVKSKKRWSQAMYLHYVLHHKSPTKIIKTERKEKPIHFPKRKPQTPTYAKHDQTNNFPKQKDYSAQGENLQKKIVLNKPESESEEWKDFSLPIKGQLEPEEWNNYSIPIKTSQQSEDWKQYSIPIKGEDVSKEWKDYSIPIKEKSENEKWRGLRVPIRKRGNGDKWQDYVTTMDNVSVPAQRRDSDNWQDFSIPILGGNSSAEPHRTLRRLRKTNPPTNVPMLSDQLHQEEISQADWSNWHDLRDDSSSDSESNWHDLRDDSTVDESLSTENSRDTHVFVPPLGSGGAFYRTNAFNPSLPSYRSSSYNPAAPFHEQDLTPPPSTADSQETTYTEDINLDDHTYILATDADMDFNDESVIQLVEFCESDYRLGGSCGRTYPIGRGNEGPIIWYQQFEYARAFWIDKTVQSVIGSVMCCPGCFSIYRCSAVRDVVEDYIDPTHSTYETFVKDTGEDRWMCTLMMLLGWKMDYHPFAANTTICPQTWEELMKQRRRWMLADMSHNLMVFAKAGRLLSHNDRFSIVFLAYLMVILLVAILTPSSTLIIVAGGLNIVFGLDFAILAAVVGFIFLAYAAICVFGSHTLQLRTIIFLIITLGIAVICLAVGAIILAIDLLRDLLETDEPTLNFVEYYLLGVLFVFLTVMVSVLLHPTEVLLLIHALTFGAMSPTMHMNMIYGLSNMIDSSWGTRDKNKSKEPTVLCCGKRGKRYHSSYSKATGKKPLAKPLAIKDPDGDGLISPIDCSINNISQLNRGTRDQIQESTFWEKTTRFDLAPDVNKGIEKDELHRGLKRARIVCLTLFLSVNFIWLVLLCSFFYYTDDDLAQLNKYGLAIDAVLGVLLFMLVFGMVVHRSQWVFRYYVVPLFKGDKPFWTYPRHW